MDKQKIIITQSIIILVLAGTMIYGLFGSSNSFNLDYSYRNQQTTGLLSPRVYSGLLPPQSYLIFNLKPLQKDLQEYITSNNLGVSLYVVNLRDGVSIGINGTKEFDPASLNKLPVAILIMKKVETGELDLDTQIEIEDEFIDENSGTLYKRGVSSLSVKELLHYMLSESDNTATRVLLNEISFEEMEELSTYLNYYNPSLYANPPSSSNNVFIVTPKSTYNLFASLYLSTVLEPEHSEYILSELTNTSFDIQKFAKIPEDVVIAQKYGSYYANGEKMFHSCGIMYIDDSRLFFCIMTENLDINEAHNVIGIIVNKIYQFIVETKKNYPGL